jgi:hypothetical protein
VRDFRDSQANNNWGAVNSAWEKRLRGKDTALNSYGVSCWHISDIQSAALWALYMPRGLGVAVRCSVRRDMESIAKSGRDIQRANVRYIDYREEQIGNDPINLLLHKRLSFSHERELRFLVKLSNDELEAVAEWHRIEEYQSKRCFGRSDTETVFGPGPQPQNKQIIKDKNIRYRTSSAGVYLPCDPNRLIQDVYLAPQAPAYLRAAMWALTKRFRLDGIRINNNLQDGVSPDNVVFH